MISRKHVLKKYREKLVKFNFNYTVRLLENKVWNTSIQTSF